MEGKAQHHAAAVVVSVPKKTADILAQIKARPPPLQDPDARDTLVKCVIHGNKILKGCAEDTQSDSDLYMSFAQLMIDYSYAMEIKLINDEFPDETSGVVIGEIAALLNEALGVVYNTLPVEESSVKEMLECIHWRKGALLYMYCHTAFNNQQRLLTTDLQKQDFQENCRQGSEFLSEMLAVRLKETNKKHYTTNHEDALELIQQGVFSDVHMLALMYGAELCYWYEMTSGPKDETFDTRRQGVKFVDKYLNVANGPLKSAGWETDTAHKLKKHWTTTSKAQSE